MWFNVDINYLFTGKLLIKNFIMTVLTYIEKESNTYGISYLITADVQYVLTTHLNLKANVPATYLNLINIVIFWEMHCS